MINHRYSVRLKVIYLPILIIIIFSIDISAKTIAKFVGDNIPAIYYLEQQHFFYHTDSLYLNDSLLERDVDYKYIYSTNSFDLSSLNISSNDTLKITYIPLPSWLKTKFGRDIPSTNSTHLKTITLNKEEKYKVINNYNSDIDISGAKSFRFNTVSSGGANLNQTLDLSITGNLTEKIEINGSISDRGYNPSYGTANSRLNELDKINLQIKSDNFIGKIGDILYQDRFVSGGGRDKRISGVSALYHNANLDFHATASRPRGQFQTTKFSGIDQLQGPYQIDSNGKSVVPGSEQVWLDGSLMERGTNKDYLIDYSIGSITFNVNHPIDSRSRIEIDYEPQKDNFKGELFSGGGGVSLGDSSVVVNVEWLREGDDRNQPLSGEISDSDKIILEEIGDSIEQAIRSGITADTNGNYILIQDSLPDSIFQYVEPGNGVFSINFSYVGDSKGDYSFLGNGIYQFKGTGNADYLPIIIIPTAQRTDQYLAKIKLKNNRLGRISAEIRQSDYDKNLYSGIDDNDNSGEMYTFSIKNKWGKNQNNYYDFKYRYKDNNYKSLNRIYNADFDRDFFLPENLNTTSNETWYRFGYGYNIYNIISINPYLSRLNYENSLDSWRGGASATIKPNYKFNTVLSMNIVRVDYDRSGEQTNGEVNKYSAGIEWKINKKWIVKTGSEYDRRTNTYTGKGDGTRYLQFTAEINHISEKLKFERFDEDSLIGDWKSSLLRHRLSLESNRQLGNLNYTSIISYQWLKEPAIKEHNFLGQMILRYNNIRRRLSFNMTYILSDETRKARGITYLKVESGGGSYIYEDGEYRPDPEGDYIKVEEILSEQAKVSRGEKIFGFTKAWDVAIFRFDSRLNEELLDGESRDGWWAIPFISNQNKAYLYFNRHYNINLKLFPVRSFYILNFEFSEDSELRNIASLSREKKNKKGLVTVRQAISNTLLEESLELFKNIQDEYYSRAGDIDGLSIKTAIRQSFGGHELKFGFKYRKAESSLSERSDLYSVISTSRWSLITNGQIRSSIELYLQSLSNINNTASYILTDNRTGSRGIIWSLDLRYGLSKSIRINFNITGRNSDNRTARITARGEMVAGF